MKNHPIGLMDSGVGGLTVLKEIQRLLPTEETVYLGDQGRLPYGPRSAAEVLQFTRQIEAFLEQQAQIKLMVIACNTATAAALKPLQAEVGIPIVGVIAPGAQAAVRTTRNHRIGVIATAGTVKSDQYHQEIVAQDAQNTVISLACPEFVTLVEANDLTSAHAQQVVAQKLAPLVAQNLDTLILGCTHFPLLRPLIQSVMGPQVTLVDPGTATAQRVATLLADKGLANDCGRVHPAGQYYTTAAVDHFDFLANQWLVQAPVHAQTVAVATLEKLAPQITEVD